MPLSGKRTPGEVNTHIVVLVGPSGAGKSTVAGELFSRYQDLTFITSCTTRPPREGDLRAKKEYTYLKEGEFQKMADANLFLWQELYDGARYGTEEKRVQEAEDGNNRIMILVPQRAKTLIKKVEERGWALDIFTFYLTVKPEELIRRLSRRYGSDKEKIRSRFEVSRGWEQEARDNGFIPIPNERNEAAPGKEAASLISQKLGWL